MSSGVIDNATIISLIESAATIVEAGDLQSTLDELVAAAVTTTGARFGALGVLGGHGALSEFRHRGMDSATVAAIGHLPVGRGLLGTIIETGTTLRITEITDHPDSVGFPPGHPPMGSFLGVPVRVGRTVFGNLYLTDKPGGFSEEDEAFVEALAVIAGSAVATARLHARLAELAVVDERERIARDMHDSVIQDLFGLGLGLQGLAMRSEPAQADRLQSAVEEIDGMITKLRSMIFDLSTRDRAVTSDRDMIRAMVERLAEPFDVSVRFDMSTDQLPTPGLSDDVRHIIEESLSNALRHSGGAEIVVTLDSFSDCILISVADDGLGFDPDSVIRGLGLGNLEARVTRLNGDLALRSDIGTGTVVEARIPL